MPGIEAPQPKPEIPRIPPITPGADLWRRPTIPQGWTPGLGYGTPDKTPDSRWDKERNPFTCQRGTKEQIGQLLN